MTRDRKAAEDRSHRGERGAVAVEFAIVVPIIVLLIGVAVVGGRLYLARAAITDAAASAARAASVSRTANLASAAAQQTATANLVERQVRCTNLSVTADVSGFAVPPGQPASVQVNLECTVSLSDTAMWGLPGSMRLHGSARSTLDTYRGRR